MDFSKIREISVYLGGRCNFECSYCDRSSVEEAGYQRLAQHDVPGIVKYITEHPYPLEMISFHGGEPFIFARVMDEVLDQLKAKGFDLKMVFVQTNGSLLLKNREFLTKWKDYLFISISYDFLFQSETRTAFDMDATLQMLNDLDIDIQLQHVIPSYDKRVFGWEHLQSILDLHHRFKISSFDMIVLRHIRGSEGRFRVILSELDINRLMKGFMRFLGILYTHGCNTYVDGSFGDSINKNYFTTPPFVILSPDGYIYTEYDFLEYKVQGSQVGNWKNSQIIPVSSISHGDDRMVYPECLECSAFHLCGIKFLHKDMNTPVTHPEHCKQFYHLMDIAHKYNNQLRSQPTLLHHLMGKRNGPASPE